MSYDLSKFTANNLSQAQDWAHLSSSDLRRRAMIAANQRDKDELWGLARAYLFLHGAKGGKVSPHTLKAYKRGVLDLIEAWRRENLIRPSRDAGVLYIRKLETLPNPRTGKTLSAASIEVKLASARALYKALRWANATEAVPFRDVKPATDPTPAWEKRKPYSPEEIEQLLDYAEINEQVLVLLGAHGGLRISEMCNLEWSDIDWLNGKIRVVGKGGKKASVSMSGKLERVLKILRASIDHRKRSKRPQNAVLPWGTFRAREKLQDLCNRAGIPYAERAVHGLRHGAGTRYYAQTKDLGRVASHLRHANIQTTRIYAKLADDAIKDDLKDW